MNKVTLEERVKKLEQEVAKLKAEKLRLKGFKIGDCFELAGVKWKILDITSRGCHCLTETMSSRKVFDKNTNNWSDSNLRKWLNNEFLNTLASEIGEDNIVEFERDLLALDGQTEYGKCSDKVSLLTVDEYRKYRELVPNADGWWWLLTPWSTKSNDDNTFVAVVSSSGDFGHGRCDDCRGVRPFCIFSSIIFESEEE